MKRVLSWLLLPLYFFLTIITLCTWDVLLKILRPLCPAIHKPFLDFGVFLLLFHLRVLGTKFFVRFEQDLPTDRPLVIVSNHQSVFDIPLLMWHLHRNSPVFVAKRELAKWVPSVSYTLRTNGSVLIDRSDPAQALPAVRSLGQFIESRKIAACIFPEGTRARDGKLKKFKPSGVMALVESAPSALVVPVAISGSWQLVRHRLLPIPWGVTVYLDVGAPIKPSDYSGPELVTAVEDMIRRTIASHS